MSHKLNPEKYISSLQARIDNWYRKNKWRREAYARLLVFNEKLDQIRHDWSNYNDNIQKPMLALNRVLLTAEGANQHWASQPMFRGRSAQSRTRFYGGAHVNG